MAKPEKKDNVTRNLVVGMVALVLVVAVAVSFGSNQAKENAKTPALVEKSEGYGIVFNKELTGVPKIDIWEDFQCPVCRNFEAINAKQVKEWIDAKKVTAVFHPLSFIGAESAYMANAAACAADEGKFLQYHEALYVNMASAENSGKWNPAVLPSDAGFVGTFRQPRISKFSSAAIFSISALTFAPCSTNAIPAA